MNYKARTYNKPEYFSKNNKDNSSVLACLIQIILSVYILRYIDKENHKGCKDSRCCFIVDLG